MLKIKFEPLQDWCEIFACDKLQSDINYCHKWCYVMYTLSKKNDTDIAHYNFNAYRPILVIFGGNIAQWEFYRMVICYASSTN